ncbi:MAG: hypothetical protein CBC73_03695 [Flavobacteriales bacterium TMED113]|nr:MAG: hypothetical protein CBC73_03695 [Flavobacteriales bacterium TMED113]|tara:strand:+ start:643 stop:837 length:195 start_codon:yes stop_codon:yes gene_type:complete
MSLLFLNLGFGEIFFILVMYLIFFGSKNLPSTAKNIGSFINKIKSSSSSISKEIKDSILDNDNK